MARATSSQPITTLLNSFVGGELSRHMDGRTDHQKYYSGCRKLKNFIVRAQGSIYRRPGSYFVDAVDDSADFHICIPFSYSDSYYDSYTLILGDCTCYFEYNGGLVQVGAVDYSIATPWGSTLLPKLRYHQYGDVLYLVHPDISPRKITRNGHESWSIAEVSFIDGPWKTQEASDLNITITPAARTGSNIALTASSALFASTDVGRLIRLGYEDPNDAESIQWGYGVIDQYTSSTSARCDIVNDFGQQYFTDPSFDVGLAQWQDTSTAAASYIQYDAVNKRMNLIQGASGIVIAEAEIEVTSGVQLTLEVAIQANPGGHVRIYVGSSVRGTNVLAVQDETTTGTKTYNFIPRYETIFITIDTQGSLITTTNTLNSVSLVRTSLTTNEWRLGAFSSGEGYPESICFHEQRLILGKGRMIFGSKTNSRYENFGFSTPVLADDAFAIELGANKVKDTKWLSSSEHLLVGTNANEIRVSAGSEGDYLSPETPIRSKPQTYHGSADINAVEGGASLLIVSKTGRKIRDLAYELAKGQYNTVDITALAEHITKSGVIDVTWAEEPEPILWCALNNGKLIGCTYMPEQGVFPWHEHTLGGDGEVESIACIPGDGYTKLVMIVKRTINGSTKRYIEYLVMPFDPGDRLDAREAIFLDSCITLDQYNSNASHLMKLSGASYNVGDALTLTASGGHTPFNAGSVGKTYALACSDTEETRVIVTAYSSTTVVTVEVLWDVPTGLQNVTTSTWALGVTSISGLGHLEAEEVSVNADGNYIGEFTVASGAITVTAPVFKAHIGLNYTSLMQPMRLEIPTYGLTLQSQNKRIVEVMTRFINTIGGQVCPGDDDEDRYEDINPLLAPVVGGEAPQLFNGDYQTNIAGDGDTAGLYTVRQTWPMPMTIVCVIPTIDV